MPRIYLDNAATTPVRPEVLAAMQPFLAETGAFGNPSSVHAAGQQARAAVDESRDALAAALSADASEITFTSGGTEADNLAVVGIMLANRGRGDHLITSAVEHEAVLNSARFLETLGFRVTFLGVDDHGLVDPDDVRRAIDGRTVLVSIMHANNEVGVIQRIEEIASIAHEHGVWLHTDAVQSFGQLPVSAATLAADAISVSAHKLYGPKGVGALYVRRGIAIEPLLHGGGQERGRRSGTENVAGIRGFAAAVECMLEERDETASRMSELRDRFLAAASTRLPGLRVNGDRVRRLPNNINISVPGIEGEAMLLNLDIAGIAASSGSACAAGSVEPSHVLLAMHLPEEALRSALRLTLGRQTTAADMDAALASLAHTVDRLRRMTVHTLSAS